MAPVAKRKSLPGAQHPDLGGCEIFRKPTGNQCILNDLGRSTTQKLRMISDIHCR
jgi:hypothetical protein